MGHQIRFFLTSEAAALLEERLLAVEPAFLFGDRTSDSQQLPVLHNAELQADPPIVFAYFARSPDVKNIVLKEVKGQNRWYVEQFFSPVVEYKRSLVDKGVKNHGRLYYISEYYDQNNILVQKPAEFRHWAQLLFDEVKKLFRYEKDLSAYVSDDARPFLDASAN